MSDFSAARQKMVDGQIRPSDVTDLRIIDAMLSVPREEYVPAHLRPMAYLDLDLDISAAGEAGRFLIKPVVLAKMLQAAELKASDKVLVVGCTSGYSAAVIGKIVGSVTNAGVAGNAASGPYDVIVVAGATEVAPTGLYGQLAPGGRLLGVFAQSKPQRATLVTHSHDDFGSRPLFDAAAPVLPGLERKAEFVF
ncbi:protein-L-isoaspartate O-methyltransferase [Rhodopseudomonas boonkerdii]|uniref:protein-L-isoaspartate O-methyltransferase family protein n=1 Tax=Rhodopseudomonas boonkerdii TaxID=475937 RepID=UPI001E3AF8D8|nr:protein-L-isoaspartate O-methyltransferase [Rhodopseudomonas boonkerdii]UGV26651.1 protein-L-isoaspartate O-methyltransferase [Rhodopseudomonas boonkerdii]